MKFTVKIKMILLVASAVLGMIGLAVMSSYQIKQVFETTNWVNVNVVPGITLMDNIRKHTLRVRVNVNKHILVSDAKELDATEASIAEHAKQMHEDVDKYMSITADEKDKALITALKAAIAEMDAAYPDILALSRAGKDKQAADLLGQHRDIFEKVASLTDDTMDYNVQLGKEASEHASSFLNTSIETATVISIVIILVASILGWYITAGLLKQLGGEPDVVAKIANQIADGDLTVTVHAKNGDTTSVMAAMKTMVDKLVAVVSEVRGSADNIASASEQVNATAQSISQATNEQAASVEETSASIEEMSASVSQNTENAKVTDGIAGKAAKDANEGGSAVKETVSAMKSIADKISIIDDIAYQTNLLALNAAIEAARAGEHGKGFAVVAAEVRKLAERSQVAAQEIGEVAKSSVGLAERAGDLLDEIVPSINKTSDLVQEIYAASDEQSSGAVQITAAMNQLSQATQQNASSSEELAATAEEMSSQAEQLQQLIAFFKVGSDDFSFASTAKKVIKKASKPNTSRASVNASMQVAEIDEDQFVKF